MTTLAELIATHAADLGDDYPSIAARLNAPSSIDNPRAGETDETTTPAPITLKSVMSIVPVAEQVAIYKELPQLIPDLKAAIDGGDREYMAGLLQIAAAAQVIGADTIAALAALLAATTTTTTVQPATIAGPSLAQAAGLGTVTSADVQAVMNS